MPAQQASSARQPLGEMNRLPVSEAGIREPRLLRKTAYLGVGSRGLSRDHLVTEIAHVSFHRCHHLEADAFALKDIGNRDDEIAVPGDRLGVMPERVKAPPPA